MNIKEYCNGIDDIELLSIISQSEQDINDLKNKYCNVINMTTIVDNIKGDKIVEINTELLQVCKLYTGLSFLIKICKDEIERRENNI